MELAIIILLVILICITLYCYLRGNHIIQLSDESLIIAFVGILATFIVVGNAQQVREISRDMNERLRLSIENEKQEREDLKKQLREEIQSYSNGIDQKFVISLMRLNDLEGKVKANLKDLKEQKRDIEEILKQIRLNMVETEHIQKDLADFVSSSQQKMQITDGEIQLIKGENAKYNQALSNFLQTFLALGTDDNSHLMWILLYDNKKNIFNVELKDGTIVPAMKSIGDKIHFVDVKTFNELSDIAKVEDIPFDSIKINEIYAKIKGILEYKGEETSPITETDNEPNDI